MKKKELYVLQITLFISSLSIMSLAFPVAALTPEETFSININIIDIHNLYGLDVQLHYNTASLDLIEAVPQPLWKPYLIAMNQINDADGIYRLIMVGSAPAPTFYGSATLAKLTFQRIDNGENDFHLEDTILSDPKGNPLLHTTEGCNIYGIPSHDVAVTRILGYPRGVVQGKPVSLEVTVENQGTFTETFDVTLYADRDRTIIGDEFTIGTQTVSDLPESTSQALNFIWDTSRVPYGAYFISAQASVVPEETDIADNFLKAAEYIGGIYPPPHVRRAADLLTRFTELFFTAVMGFGGLFGIKRYWFP